MTDPRRHALRRHWAVTVSADGDPLVTIETNCVSGRDLTAADCDLIEHAAKHLLAFIGRDAARFEAMEVCRILAEDLDWCIGYELGEKNQEPLDRACDLAAKVWDAARAAAPEEP